MRREQGRQQLNLRRTRRGEEGIGRQQLNLRPTKRGEEGTKVWPLLPCPPSSRQLSHSKFLNSLLEMSIPMCPQTGVQRVRLSLSMVPGCGLVSDWCHLLESEAQPRGQRMEARSLGLVLGAIDGACADTTLFLQMTS